ncbi:cobalamin/Fe3+-siderophore ABC transporter ATP-binding protein [Pilimelia terevasa]|uniref:Cobalamin/Fe3+-siderophore ABC transporter ATP-binding protein n=1 Tax=Pilimelia terevasa TaxID=53372 RepID=A0A8J3BN44_9ACTN|nr:ABC transporter ATP-binding protein [Pilimelia terevasa]GGK23375.1 cobalamin/Fe3+-siderophore ABC transporter ATP-binding protein [Pilimelia terevasa]
MTTANPPAPAAAPAVRLRAEGLTVGYADRTIIAGLDLDLPAGKVTAVVGANACGKSTLLKTMARLLTPRAGGVMLDGQAIHRMRTADVARTLGILPQSPVAPDGLTVVDLVSRGRAPHQAWWRQWGRGDERAVGEALAATGMADHADRMVDELSGGQRQRAWIAMAIAQETPILLLDEPTTFLDIAHQIDVLDLVLDLNRRRGRTVAMVLHDINQACRYADHLVAMKSGVIVAQGAPAAIVTSALIEEVFDLDCRIVADPVSHTPMIVPIGRHHSAPPAC